jgi:hypothetical protein
MRPIYRKKCQAITEANIGITGLPYKDIRLHVELGTHKDNMKLEI